MAVTAENILPTDTFIRRWTNAEYLALEKKRAADIAANKIGNAKNFDIVMAADVLRLNSQKVQTLKAELVADGVISAERSEIIFGPDLGQG